MERIERRDFPESKGSNSVRGYFLWMAGTLFVWAPVYYVLFHLLIGIPIRLLYVPAAVHFIVLLLIAVIAVHAYTRFESPGRRDIIRRCHDLYVLFGAVPYLFRDSNRSHPTRPRDLQLQKRVRLYLEPA
jgi:hypothetical protein